jgi:hypothetical protein
MKQVHYQECPAIQQSDVAAYHYMALKSRWLPITPMVADITFG